MCLCLDMKHKAVLLEIETVRVDLIKFLEKSRSTSIDGNGIFCLTSKQILGMQSTRGFDLPQ